MSAFSSVTAATPKQSHESNPREVQHVSSLQFIYHVGHHLTYGFYLSNPHAIFVVHFCLLGSANCCRTKATCVIHVCRLGQPHAFPAYP